MRNALLLLSFGYLGVMVGFVYPVLLHVFDSSWSDHARNHVLQSLFWLEGYCGLGLWITWGGLRQKQRWAWWASVWAGVFLYGGYFLAIPITGGGAPGLGDDVMLSLLGTLHFGALLWMRKQIWDQPSSD